MKSLRNRRFQLAHLLAVSTVLVGGMAAASAQITAIGQTLSSQMPGDPTDFTFVGSSSSYSSLPNFATDTIPGTSDLNDFAVAPGGNASGIFSVDSSIQPGGYATISAPAGYTGTPAAPSTVQTAVVFQNSPGNDAPDLLNVTLGNQNYNYSDFFLIVMFGNYGVTNQDAAIDLTVIDPSGNFSLVAPVVDNSASNTAANFEEFEIKGATGGDEIELGAKPDAGANAVIGGLSFSQTEVAIPEPSTWALIATAALVLGWRLRRQGSIS